MPEASRTNVPGTATSNATSDQASTPAPRTRTRASLWDVTSMPTPASAPTLTSAPVETSVSIERRMQQKEEEMRARQQVLRLRRQKEELKRRQRRAALQVRRVIQRLRSATLDNVKELRAQQEAAHLEQLEEMGEEAEKVREEADAAFEQVQQRLAKQQQEREEMERRRAEEEAKRQEEKQWLATITKAAIEKVEAAEGKAGKASEAVSAVCENRDAEGALAAGEGAADALEAARAALEDAKQVLFDKREEMGNTPEALKVKNGPEFGTLAQRIAAAIRSVSDLVSDLKVAKDRATRQVAAEKKTKEQRAQFDKYNIMGDGMLARQELSIFALEECGFELNEEQLNKIFSKLASTEASTGIPFSRFQQMRSMVAIERSVVKAREREKAAKEEAERFAKQREETMEAIRAALASVKDSLTTAEEGLAKADEAAAKLSPHASDALPLYQVRSTAKEVESEVNPALDALKAAETSLSQVAEVDTKDDWKVRNFCEAELADAKERVNRTRNSLRGLVDVYTEALNRVERSASAQNERLRFSIAALACRIMQLEEKSREQLFHELEGGAGGSASSANFVVFVKSLCDRCPPQDLPERLAPDVLEDAVLGKLFDHITRGRAKLTKDRFAEVLSCFAYRVVKDIAITCSESLQSKLLRCLETGEVVRALELPKAVEGAKRLRCRTANDELEGWATISGNQGTVFLEERSTIYVCVSETIMTDGLSVSDSKTVRKVRKGEVLEAIELDRKDKSIGAMRAKCRARKDGKTGFVTVTGNKGTSFLEPS